MQHYNYKVIWLAVNNGEVADDDCQLISCVKMLESHVREKLESHICYILVSTALFYAMISCSYSATM